MKAKTIWALIAICFVGLGMSFEVLADRIELPLAEREFPAYF